MLPRVSKVLLVVGVVVAIAYGFLSFRSPAPKESVPIRIGYFQSHMGSAPILVGEAEGLFQNAGIATQKTLLASSNQAMDALVRGDIDISLLSLIPVLNAETVDPGKVKIFAVSAMTNEKPFDSVVVKNDSPIQSVQDLAGKKVAVFPGTTATAFLKHYLKAQGVDISKTEFVQMSLSEHLGALASGAVHAAHLYEPMLSIGLESKNIRVVMKSVYASTSDRSPIGVYVVSTKFVNEHPDLAKKAVAALETAMAYSDSHPMEASQAVAAEFKLDPNVASRMSLLPYVSTKDLQTSSLTSFIDLLIALGEVKAQPNFATLLYH